MAGDDDEVRRHRDRRVQRYRMQVAPWIAIGGGLVLLVMGAGFLAMGEAGDAGVVIGVGVAIIAFVGVLALVTRRRTSSS